MKIKTVFGYPGASVIDIYDSLFRASRNDADAPSHILARHEQGAVHAAVGYAKASGKVGVCIATSGPGATNLITGIADAYLDSAPVVIITGQVNTSSIGHDAFQEADIMGITIPITKHNYLIKSADALKKALPEAFRIAETPRCGPVLIDIAKDVLTGEIPDGEICEVSLPRKRKNDYPLESSLPAIKEALENSYRPLILAGGGVVADKASSSLSEYAEKTGIPVVTTLMGMGITLGENVNLYGMTGRYGCPAARAASSQCDLLIAVGTRFSDRTIANFTLFSKSRMIIHIDIDPAEIRKNVYADVAAVCGAKEFFDTISKLDIAYKHSAIKTWNKNLLDIKKSKPENTVQDETTDRLTCRDVLRCIDEVESKYRDAVYVTDVGNHQMTAAVELEPLFERGFITSGGLGAMGFGLPAAIGAGIALSESDSEGMSLNGESKESVKNIILICGDGGFQMTMQELATLKASPIPIKIFVFDNSSLGMIHDMQGELEGGRFFASELPDNPNLGMIASAFGIKSLTLSKSNLKSSVEKILCDRENVFVHIETSDLPHYNI